MRRPRAVGSVTVGHGVNEFFSIVIPPIIPLLVADFGITYGQAGVLVTIFFVMYALFQLPAGMLADVIGKERLLIAGLFGMAGGVLVASMATSYETLLVAQAIAGISGSAFHPTGMALVSDYETKQTEGKAMGVFGFGGALGTMSAPVIVGGVAAVADWRLALATGVAIGVLVTCLVVYLFVTAEEPDVDEVDGTDDESASTARTDGGRSESTQSVRAAIWNAIDLPITPSIVVLFFVTVVLSMQHRAIQTYTTSYVAAETGASVAAGNVTFFALLVGGSLASLYAGDLADRFDRITLGIAASLATAALVAATLATTLLEGLPIELLTAILAVWFAVIGAGMYASYPVKNAMVSQQAEATSSGSLFGVIQTGSAIGSASGPTVFGVLSTRWGVVAAFPAIAAVSVALALSFGLLWFVTD
ncbi:major facilitator superfamily transport protein (plasmid) [Natrialba magadii ATCC 43099]|uniref:Major facilitator superfamily transport protein n=1 Tax=Natrialba magadii (strain ATCC 43099 / DSM 3394 / CCM 3739 / CIP 104546 / IAM 13178 / JCM 8861 / NBRC 102185 / NCIMB 2190 / MS3) TaxID=547559 RepID=D3T152_NATMM|nr:MFS transporter [Natrialba magadii]ADD07311.1 major facilitator superfamily transport protein [Natrialba magadii ATCC 43099]